MTTIERDVIGRICVIEIENMQINMKILDIRARYRSLDYYLVTPMCGHGTKWILSDRASLVGE